MRYLKLILLILLMALVPVWARSQGQLTACKSNLKNIGTALEMYSTDNEGRYPPTMAHLTPNYLKTIPSCPMTGRDTYSKSYYNEREPDTYAVYCQGYNHEIVDIPPNHPAYDGFTGLNEGREIVITVAQCESSILEAAEEIKKFHETHGRYPEELTELKDLSMPHKNYWFVSHDQNFEIGCVGTFHVSQGVQAFYPRYTTAGGLKKIAIEAAPVKKKAPPWPKIIGGAALCLLLIWAVFGGKREAS